MKIFISQPMRGLTDEQIKEHRQTAIDYLQRRFPGCEIIDSFFEGEADPNNPLELLGKSIQMLNGVDAIYMLRGWQNARGCMTEHDIAWRYNIGVIYEDQEDCKDTQKLFKEAEELDETIPYMLSDSFKDRVYAEYWQTKLRYNNLHRMLIKYDAGTLNFKPNCSKELLSEQASAMGRYLYLLEMRSEIEGINLGF